MDGRFQTIVDRVCGNGCTVRPDVLEAVIALGVEIAREGREGRKIGTLFVVGDREAVMRHSRPMILDPLYGHPDEAKRLEDPDTCETVKELAQLDGAFVICERGVVHAAARYLDARSDGLQLKLGLGSRHLAAAAITRATESVAVVVSESSVVRTFYRGELISEIIPEVWIMRGLDAEDDGMRGAVTILNEGGGL